MGALLLSFVPFTSLLNIFMSNVFLSNIQICLYNHRVFIRIHCAALQFTKLTLLFPSSYEITVSFPSSHTSYSLMKDIYIALIPDKSSSVAVHISQPCVSIINKILSQSSSHHY